MDDKINTIFSFILFLFFKNKWEKIHNTSDNKRFVYLVKELRTFRGKNKGLDDWVNKNFM